MELPQQALQKANALNNMFSNTALIIGAALAGILVSTVGSTTALAIDAATFFIAGIVVYTFKHVTPPMEIVENTVLHDLKEGWRVFTSFRWLVVIDICFAFIVMSWAAGENVLGPLVARIGIAEVALPGGDAIGSRGLDFHIRGLESLGAKAHNEHGYVIAEAPNGLTGAEIVLDFPSVGATENLMTAAVLAKGVTTIDNAAREPDLVDLGNFLISMGAKIEGLGTPLITITGVTKMHPTDHATIADRIVTGTWAFAAAMTQGDITINGARAQDLEIPLEKLTAAGAIITSNENSIRVRMDSRPKAIDVSTLPYPGFPTDLQPMVITLNAIATGDAMVTENVFEGRFMFVNELIRLGAQITIDGHHAAITGVEKLSSAPVVATDIRAGAGLVLAGLVSDGITFVEDGYHIDRGYPDFAKQLRALGADVTREL